MIFSLTIFAQKYVLADSTDNDLHPEQSELNPQKGEKISLKVNYLMSGLIMDFVDMKEEANDLTYSSDMMHSFGVDVSVIGINLGFSYAVNTRWKNVDVFLGFFQKKFGIETYFQFYKGFRLVDDSLEPVDTFTPNSFPSMKMYNGGIGIYYFFFDDFSYNAAFYQTEKKEQFGWSPFIKCKPYYFRFENSSPIIPLSQQVHYGKYEDLVKGDAYGIAITAGVSVIYPIFDFNIAASLNLGVSILYQNLTTLDESENSKKVNFSFDYKISGWYDGSDIFFGMWFYNENQFGEVGPFNNQLSTVRLNLFAGLRM